MGYGKFNEIRDASPLSLHSLNDMLRYLYNRVQGGITGKELQSGFADTLVQNAQFRAALQQQSDALRLEVGKLGGGNSLLNSGFECGIRHWVATGAYSHGASSGRDGRGAVTLTGTPGGTAQIAQLVTLPVARSGPFVAACQACSTALERGAGDSLAAFMVTVLTNSGALTYETPLELGTQPWRKYEVAVDPGNALVQSLEVKLLLRDCTGAVCLDEVQLQEGRMASGWTPALGELTNAAIRVTQNEVHIQTPQYTMRLMDPDAPDVTTVDMTGRSQSFQRLYVGNLACGNALLRYDGPAVVAIDPGGGGDYRSFSEAVEALPRYLTRDVVLKGRSANGVYQEPDGVRVQGFCGGGSLTLDLHGGTLRGSLVFAGCSARTGVQDGVILGPSNAQAVVAAQHCAYTELTDLVVLAQTETEYGVLALAGSRALVARCNIRDATLAAVCAGCGSQVALSDCQGLSGATGYGLLADAGILHAAGSAPTGGAGFTKATGGGYVFGEPTQGAGSDSQPGGEGSNAYRWTAHSFATWHTGQPGGWRAERPYPMQGDDAPYGASYGNHTGCIFFGSDATADMRSRLVGRSIQSVRLRLQRQSAGGEATEGAVSLYTHNHDSQPSGAPSLGLVAEDAATLGWGQAQWIALPVAFGTALATGDARGFALYRSSGSPYQLYEPTATLEVICS